MPDAAPTHALKIHTSPHFPTPFHTHRSYTELYDLDGCCSFVADFLAFERLEDPLHPPEHLPSPMSSLGWQAGDCFDLAVVLASLLIGVGYNAFVVVGYAPEPVTANDQTRTVCPVLEKEARVAAAAAAGAAAGGPPSSAKGGVRGAGAAALSAGGAATGADGGGGKGRGKDGKDDGKVRCVGGIGRAEWGCGGVYYNSSSEPA